MRKENQFLILIVLIFCFACRENNFDKEFFLCHNAMYKKALFTPLHYAIDSEFQKDSKNKIFYDQLIVWDSLYEIFFNKTFMKGDLEFSKLEFKKLISFYNLLFSNKRLFLPIEITEMKLISNKMGKQETNNQLFFDYLLLRGNGLTKLSESTTSCSWSYKWDQIQIDTINFKGQIKILHIYDREIVKNQFVEAKITALTRNKINLLDQATILKVPSHFSLLIPCDMDTGVINLKAKINEIITKQIVHTYDFDDKIYNDAYWKW